MLRTRSESRASSHYYITNSIGILGTELIVAVVCALLRTTTQNLPSHILLSCGSCFIADDVAHPNTCSAGPTYQDKSADW